MAHGMWGAPIGISQVLEDSRKDALAGMTLLESAGRLSELPSQIEDRRAGTRVKNAQADKLETEMAAQRRMMEILGKGGAQNSADPVEQLTTLGNAALQAGDFDGGTKFINAASQVRSRVATERFRAAQAAEIDMRAESRRMEQIGGVAGSARDDASHAAALMRLAELGVDVSAIPKNYAQGGQVMRDLATQSMTAYQQGRVRIAENTERTRIQTQRDMAEHRRQMRELAREREERQRERDARRQKEGGGTGGGGSPLPRERSAAAAVMKEAGIRMDEDSTRLITQSVASRAKVLVKQNKGLDFDQALRQALKEEQDAGNIQDADSVLRFLPGANNKKYTKIPEGSTLEKPIKTVPPAGQRQTDKWYMTPRGPLQWKGNGWADPGAK